MQQGSREWLAIRMGLPTASQFHRIVTPAKLVASSQAAGYMHELLAETFLPLPPDSDPVTGFMSRGNELEPLARRYYEFGHDVEVKEVGFVTDDAGTVGCSPDGLVGDDGGLEIKCPSAANHIAALLNPKGGISPAYRLQVQGNLAICERDWWDELSFHPTLTGSERRIFRDEGVIAVLTKEIAAFNEKLARAADILVALGCDPCKEPIPEEVLA